MLPPFILILFFLYRKIETRRTLKLGVGLTLISSYGFIMATLATTMAFMFKLIPGIPPQIQITNFNRYCEENSLNCFKISNTFAIDLASIYIILFTIGILLLLYIFLQLMLGVIFYSKIRKSRNPVLSQYWNSYFSRKTGLPLNNIDIHVINSKRIEAFSFSVLPLSKTFAKNNFVVISTELLKSLTEQEILTVIAHEYSHVYLQDTIWIPFIKILGSTRVFFLKKLSSRLTKSVELRADKLSVQWTRTPGHLASALVKIYENSLNKFIPKSEKLATSIHSKQKDFLVQRIETLLQIDVKSLPFNWPKW
ncbi:MAG: M48 family metallopeptidase [Candidatus Hodarchaeales archaeon]|jgi:Zn-dependent protease with chaperone function